MNSKQFRIVFVLFAVLLAVAMVGGTWVTALAQDFSTNQAPVGGIGIPITGCNISLPISDGSCEGPYVKGLGGVCVPFGATDFEVKAIGDPTIPGLDQVKAVTDVLKVSVVQDGKDTTDYTFGDSIIVYFTHQGAIQNFMAESTNSILWYNAGTGKWEKVETSLQDGKLVDENIYSGLYLVGSLVTN